MTDNIVWAFWGHEPLAQFYRAGSKRGSIFRLGEWSEAWYERLHSEEALHKAASLGVNVIYTHYFKGFGLEAEHGEMERTRELAEVAHRLGMRVLGYCQLGSLYYETMLDEADDLEDWVMRDARGSVACWGGAYYRWSPCFTSAAYKSYMKRVIRYGLEHVKLDGFHFDNSYNKPCYCPRCQQAFRDYLIEHVRDPERELGLPHVRHVRVPAFADGEGVHDPLYAMWLGFRRQLTASLHAELFDYVKLLSDERALVMHNPAFPRQWGHVNRIGYEPADSPATVDIVVAENDKFIGRSGPDLRTQIEAYKYGERFGYRVFNSSWLKDEQRQIRVPETEAEIALYEAESMVYGGLCGTPWLMRSLKREAESVLDRDVQTRALSPIFAYFKRHSELYESVRPANSVKVLYNPHNIMLAIQPGYLSLLAVVQCLIESALPFSYVTPDEVESLREGETLILPHLTYAANAEIESLRALAAKGHPIAVIGPLGTYDERGVERTERELLPTAAHILRIESLAVAKEGDLGKHMTSVSAQLGNNAERLVSFVRDRSRGLRVMLSEPGLLCETTEDAQGRLLVHLIRPDNAGDPLDRVTVRLMHDSGASYAHAELFSFEQPRLVGFDGREGTTELTIEALSTLATVRLSGRFSWTS